MLCYRFRPNSFIGLVLLYYPLWCFYFEVRAEVRAVSNAGWRNVRLSNFNRIIGKSRSSWLLCHMLILFCLIVHIAAILSLKCVLYDGWQCTLRGWGVVSADVWDARWYISSDHVVFRFPQVNLTAVAPPTVSVWHRWVTEKIKVLVWRSTLCPTSPSSHNGGCLNEAGYSGAVTRIVAALQHHHRKSGGLTPFGHRRLYNRRKKKTQHR